MENNELMSFEAELEKEALEQASKEYSTDRMPILSIKSGVLKLGDTTFQGNKIAVIIAGDVFENVYYNTKYNPDTTPSPVCFAFSHNQDEMKANPLDVKECQADTCQVCPKNEFGSADTGRGKACSNRRRLVLIPAGEFSKKTNEWLIEDEADFYRGAEPAMISIPPTSLVEVAKYIKSVANEYKRPVNAVITELSVVPDDRRQFAVKFKVIDTISKEIYDIVKTRAKGLLESATIPYSYKDEE